MAAGVASGTPVYTIGRYEIAGHLATGGMAEILLGRMVGPAGFERPVVIKRILPHLAKDPHFRNMFLDEARIAARIHHPNVVQVHELMEEDGELFIVMEYLEGENLAGLMRRLQKHGERLSPVLCAYVVSEAAAGLQAAHEITDLDGQSMGLVHRDVSPQNIFITYDGTVKVLDFGIATAADRLSRTETGQLKGKFEYMSPEQCAGKDLDQRSDLFPLGTILWETSTGHRLFKFPNKLLVLKAIVDTPVKAPSEVVDEYPANLEQVVVRTLARKRVDRYQTAEELRRDLLRVIHTLDPENVPDQSLREVMRRIFQERMEEKREMLQRLRSGSELTHLPTAEVDAAVELPTIGEPIVDDFEADEGVSRIQPTPSARPSPPEPSARGRGIVVMVAAAALIGGAIFLATKGDDAAVSAAPRAGEPTRAATPPAEESAAEDTRAETPQGEEEPGVPEDEGEPEAQEDRAHAAEVDEEIAAADAGRVAVTPTTVVLHVETTPPGAEVVVDDVVRGTTPMDLHVVRADEPIEIELRAEQYVTERVQATPDLDQRVRVHMTQAAEPQPRRRWRRPRRRASPQPMGTAEPERRYHRFE